MEGSAPSSLLDARPVRIALAVGFVVLTLYALVAAPPRDVAMESAMWTFRFDGIDASVVALFLTMGLNADLFVVFLLRDARRRRVPGWPFAVASFALGSFVVLPYLALRGAPRLPSRRAGVVTRVASSRPVGWLIAAGFLGVIVLAVWGGDVGAFARAFEGTWFVHVMALDFVVECVLLWVIVADLRRVDPPHHEPRLARVLLMIPILGPALWNATAVHDPR